MKRCVNARGLLCHGWALIVACSVGLALLGLFHAALPAALVGAGLAYGLVLLTLSVGTVGKP